MKSFAMITLGLGALAALVWSQQNPATKSADSSKAGVFESCEIRAYLLNKQRETVNINGITAVLTVEGKDGAEIVIPLQVITTKTGEKYSVQSSRPPREVEGTDFFASLVTVHPDASRQSEGNDADRRLAKGSTQEPNGKEQASPADSGKNRFTLEGPYFKADLTREQLGAFTCQASVRFTIKGTNHTAKGFSCALARGLLTQGAGCERLGEDCRQVERHLKANEMEKARIAVDRLAASLCAACGEAPCQRAQHGCTSCCKDLRAAVSTGNREKALEALDALKSHCSPCSPSKAESTTDVEKK